MKELTKPRYSIQDLQKFAQDLDGECLTNEYINTAQTITWKCNKNHVWTSKWSNTKKHRWCTVCKKEQEKQSLFNELKELVTKNKGTLLSTTYDKIQSKYEIKCEKGHVWKITAAMLKEGYWCPSCNAFGNRRAGYIKPKIKIDLLKKANEVALLNNGICISKVCELNSSLLEWKCKNNHYWSDTLTNIKKGKWCSDCKQNEYLLEQYNRLKTFVENKGGVLLSKTYILCDSTYEIKCSKNHIWNPRASSLYTGSWCPSCINGRYENICRTFFEQLFKEKFVRIRPDWLVNPNTNRRLELDGYCEKLKLAFEHQGVHHYSDHIFGAEQLKKVQQRDEIKKHLCDKLGITLVRIPELMSRTPIDNLKTFIKDQITNSKPSLLINFHDIPVDVTNFPSIGQLELLQKIAKEYGGECLANEIINNKTEVPWKCKQGHIFNKKPSLVKLGHFCNECSGTKRKTIEDMHEIARKKSGKCLSSEYKRNNTKLKWQCNKNHIFECTYGNVHSGRWCLECVNEKRRISPLTLLDAQNIAISKGGTCIATSFKNSRQRLEWKCDKGHTWFACYSVVKYTSWCPECNTLRRKNKLN